MARRSTTGSTPTPDRVSRRRPGVQDLARALESVGVADVGQGLTLALDIDDVDAQIDALVGRARAAGYADLIEERLEERRWALVRAEHAAATAAGRAGRSAVAARSMVDPRSLSPDHVIRYHEAGHAVAAVALGVRVYRVDTGIASGSASHAPVAIRDGIVIALAGEAVERVLGLGDAGARSAADLEAARVEASRIASDVGSLIGRLRLEALALMRDRFAEVARLVEAIGDAGGALAGEGLELALDYAFQRPTRRPGSRASGPDATAILHDFTIRRRAIFERLAAEAGEGATGREPALWSQADRLALEGLPE